MDRATGPPAEAIAVPHQALVHNHPRTPRTTGRPPALSQAEEIGAAPAHLRRNRARAELAESFGAGSVLDLPGRPPVDDPDQPRTLIVDGTPVPCRDRKHEPGPHSGRHHRAGPGLQDACTPAGRPVRVPGPAPGSTHDARAPQRTGLLDNPPDTPPLGDEGRIGPGMTTPVRRPPRGRTRGPAETAQQDHQFVTGPGRTSNSPTEDLADTPHRLPQTPPHLPTNHHSSHRTRILQE